MVYLFLLYSWEMSSAQQLAHHASQNVLLQISCKMDADRTFCNHAK